MSSKSALKSLNSAESSRRERTFSPALKPDRSDYELISAHSSTQLCLFHYWLLYGCIQKRLYVLPLIWIFENNVFLSISFDIDEQQHKENTERREGWLISVSSSQRRLCLHFYSNQSWFIPLINLLGSEKAEDKSVWSSWSILDFCLHVNVLLGFLHLH